MALASRNNTDRRRWTTVNKQTLCLMYAHIFDMWRDIKRKYKIALGIQRRDIANCVVFRGREHNMLVYVDFCGVDEDRDEIKWSSKCHKALNDVFSFSSS